MTTKSTDSASRLTAREYACLHIKVPQSGNDWLDELIQAARGMDAEVRTRYVSYEQASGRVERTPLEQLKDKAFENPEVEAEYDQIVESEQKTDKKPTKATKPQGPKDPPAGGAGTKIG